MARIPSNHQTSVIIITRSVPQGYQQAIVQRHLIFQSWGPPQQPGTGTHGKASKAGWPKSGLLDLRLGLGLVPASSYAMRNRPPPPGTWVDAYTRHPAV